MAAHVQGSHVMVLWPVLATVAAWVFLARVNEFWADALAWSAGVTWLYLPAAIRPLAVLLFGWRGALGIFLGSLLSMLLFSDAPLQRGVVVAGLSALAPLVAVTGVLRWLPVRPDLHGMTATHLVLVAAACSALSVSAHNLYYWHSALHDSLLAGMLPMFIGDMLGTLLVLYVARSLLRLQARLRAVRRP